MQYLVRAQNWFFRQILIFPLRLALIIVAMVVFAGWGLLEHRHPLTSHYYPVLVVLAAANLVIAVVRKRRRRIR